MELKKIEKIAMENVSHEKGGVDVVKMAHSYDINVYAADVDPSFNAEIQYNKDEDSYNIFVNSRHPLPRQRFSIAHEIAHFLLHQDLIQERGSLNRKNTDAHTTCKKLSQTSRNYSSRRYAKRCTTTYCYVLSCLSICSCSPSS
jgi:Zn-dependent peptidase ImmA (M78 family)